MDGIERPLLHVVAGVVLNEAGDYLLSSRPEGKPYAGYWEFAGGKVEPGESESAALRREFAEELGIKIRAARPWLTKIYDYEHARVFLRFFRVEANQWTGEIQAREGQQWSWQKSGDFTVSPMLPANTLLLQALAVPSVLQGSRSRGYWGENCSGGYRIVPVEHKLQTALADDDVHFLHEAAPDAPVADGLWYYVERNGQWDFVPQNAAGVVWRAADGDSAAETVGRLRQGVPVPVLIDCTRSLYEQYAADWLALGAHALVVND
ncbi:MAG: NUDIX domain-containing protein [Neisseria sp.]|nr:NUDIX domain-containing protein [Neisseria sp.]